MIAGCIGVLAFMHETLHMFIKKKLYKNAYLLNIQPCAPWIKCKSLRIIVTLTCVNLVLYIYIEYICLISLYKEFETWKHVKKEVVCCKKKANHCSKLDITLKS